MISIHFTSPWLEKTFISKSDSFPINRKSCGSPPKLPIWTRKHRSSCEATICRADKRWVRWVGSFYPINLMVGSTLAPAAKPAVELLVGWWDWFALWRISLVGCLLMTIQREPNILDLKFNLSIANCTLFLRCGGNRNTSNINEVNHIPPVGIYRNNIWGYCARRISGSDNEDRGLNNFPQLGHGTLEVSGDDGVPCPAHCRLAEEALTRFQFPRTMND